MNNSINSNNLLKELQHNIEVDGLPPVDENFGAICEYVRDFMVRKYNLYYDDEINRGYCFIWAYLVWALWDKPGITFLTCTGHVIIKYEGKYWDSEHCEGEVEDMLSEFCGFLHADMHKHIDVRWMCWYWARAGAEKKELRRWVRKLAPKLYKLVRDNGKKYWDNAYDFCGYEEIEKLREVT